MVIPGGTGQVGGVLRRALSARGDEVVVLSRHPHELEPGVRHVAWDGRTLGDWASEVDGADAVVNLAGRTVSCRYTDENLRQMMDSRVESTRVVGEAIAQAAVPPGVWLQMSTATIYADRRDAPNDEATGIIGGHEPGVPDYWEYSVRIARSWEAAQQEAVLPHTRRVALRAAMVMSPDRGGVFDVLLGMTRLGLGGPVAGGGQYVSWIHDHDFVRAVELLLDRDDLDGPVNLAAPGPLHATRPDAWPALGLGPTARPPGHGVDGRDRGLGDADRHRAAAQEPPGRSRTAPRRGVRVRAPAVARGRRGPGGPGALPRRGVRRDAPRLTPADRPRTRAVLRRPETAGPVPRTRHTSDGYGHEVSFDPFDLLALLVIWTVPLVVGYFVIRLAVRHGVMDAHRRLPSREDPPV